LLSCAAKDPMIYSSSNMNWFEKNIEKQCQTKDTWCDSMDYTTSTPDGKHVIHVAGEDTIIENCYPGLPYWKYLLGIGLTTYEQLGLLY
jgi:hypothetical protein